MARLDVGGPGSSLTNSGLITISTPLVAGAGVQHFIDGSFTQTRTGTLALRVLPDSSAGNYDSLQVTGVANLGGTLKPIAQPGLYGPTTTYAGVVSFASSTGQLQRRRAGLALPVVVAGLPRRQRRPGADPPAVQQRLRRRRQPTRGRSATCWRPTTRPASPAHSRPSTATCWCRPRPIPWRSSPAR